MTKDFYHKNMYNRKTNQMNLHTYNLYCTMQYTHIHTYVVMLSLSLLYRIIPSDIMISPRCALLTVAEDRFLCDQSISSSHFIQHGSHPVLYSAFSNHCCTEIHLLSFTGYHGISHRLPRMTLAKPQLGNVIKHLKM